MTFSDAHLDPSRQRFAGVAVDSRPRARAKSSSKRAVLGLGSKSDGLAPASVWYDGMLCHTALSAGKASV